MSILQHIVAVLARVFLCVPLLALEQLMSVIQSLATAIQNFCWKAREYVHVVAPVPWMTKLIESQNEREEQARKALLKTLRGY